jgi:hypothetical protein
MEKTDEKIVRTGGSLSWKERESMIQEYLTGNYTKVEIWEKYTGQDQEHGQMLRWMRNLGYLPNTIPRRRSSVIRHSRLPINLIVDTPKKDQDPAQLLQRIKELEKQLEMAQLKAEGFELMIDLAEKELKLPIRKKSDTK